MDYISFQWHMSLTIKHKRELGAKGLREGGLYIIQNLRVVVRESASSGSSTGCQETLNLACMLPPPPILAGLSLSLSLSLYCFCLPALVFLPHPSLSPGSHLGAGGHLGSTCASCLNVRARVLFVCRIPPVISSRRGGKISSRCCCSSGRVLFIMAIL